MNRHLALWPIAAAALLLVARASAADPRAAFEAANRLYDEGRFTNAAAAYAKILRSGAAAPALYYNYGNAEFKEHHLGLAIAAYRRAAQLAPRDDDVRANLAFARHQVQGPTLQPPRWRSWLDTVTLNEWTGATAAAFWLVFVLLVATQIRPGRRRILRRFALLAGLVTLLCGTGLGLAAANRFASRTAVVVTPKAVARTGPFAEAQRAFTVHDGAELAVLDRRHDWLQVTDGTSRIGWLQRKQVEVMPGS